MEVIQQDNIVVIQHVNSIYSSNTYFITSKCDDNVWLVDCGDFMFVDEWLKENNKVLSRVFITHSHFDHIYGLNLLKEKYPNIKVYTSINGRLGLASEKYNFSKYHGCHFFYDKEDIVCINDGDFLELISKIVSLCE